MCPASHMWLSVGTLAQFSDQTRSETPDSLVMATTELPSKQAFGNAFDKSLTASSDSVGREHISLRPHESYEGGHRWDPEATWTAKEEAAVVRKADIRLLLWICVMFFGLQLDRGNISNALTDKLLDDLGMTSNDYNNGTTVQLIAFLAAEFPVQLLIKRYGFKQVLPLLMMMWGTVSWAQAFMTDRVGFYITRALIGACEGGFIPGTILFATYFYTSRELSVRLAAFWSTLNVARIISSLLAAGILKMRGVAGKPGWFWLFLVRVHLVSQPVSTDAILARRPSDFCHWLHQLSLLTNLAHADQWTTMAPAVVH